MMRMLCRRPVTVGAGRSSLGAALLFSLLLGAVLAGCAGRVTPVQAPADPLAEHYLQRALAAERIAYTRNYAGHYTALKPEQQGRLEQLGRDARALDRPRESLSVASRCARAALRGYLDRAGALYAIEGGEGAYQLHMFAADFARLSVAEKYRQLREDCEPRGE